MSELIIVGSGIGGLVTALRADAAGHRVTVVTKRQLCESNTRYAQGGIAAAVFDDDSVAAHVEDTMIAGAGLSVREAVEVLCSEGPDRIRDLIRWGVAFDRSGDALARGLEAAHSSARILHAGGDSTGAAIEWALVAAMRASGVTVIEHAFATSLLQSGVRVTGVDLLMADGTSLSLHADAVVLATGGAGQLYPHTTNPELATGDGVALALRAGAVLRDLEFFQFHPTALALPGNFLVSEAVRGEGAVLLNERGERFMTALHPDAELAPRDIVARAIAAEMEKQGGAPVRLNATALNATALGASKLASRFPTIDKATRAAGMDWSREPIPVTPAAHYWMGGVATDLHGRTSLPGLFAVGEVASTGVHGANRLASNSLLEAAVFGWRVSDVLHIVDDAGADFPGSEFVELDKPIPDGLDTASSPVELDRVELDREGIQSLLWAVAGLHRNGDDLARAAEMLATAIPATAPDPADCDAAPATVRKHEDANLLDIARVLVAAAAARHESRGAHFRTDFPEPSPRFAHPLVLRGSRAHAREDRVHAYS